MYKYLIYLFFLLAPLTALGQVGSEIGTNLGAGSYIGDLNPYKLFYAPRLSGGVFVRHNFSQHYALRVGLGYNRIQGNDKDFVTNIYQQIRQHQFQTDIIEISSVGEFNFLPLNPGLIRKNKEIFSPYVLLGVGVFFGNGGQAEAPVNFAIPFGLGAKYYITHALGVGAEIVWRKTFSDQLDQLAPYVFRENASQFSNKQQNINNNSDWYYIFAATISYRFVKNEDLCPAFK